MPQPDRWRADRSHEKDDSLEKTGLRWAASFAIFIGFGIVLAFGSYWLVAPQPFNPAVEHQDRRLPPDPKLRDNQTRRSETAALRRHEEEVLTTSGESLYHSGAKRIPIEDAISKMALTGLPAHPVKPGTYQLTPSADQARTSPPDHERPGGGA